MKRRDLLSLIPAALAASFISLTQKPALAKYAGRLMIGDKVVGYANATLIVDRWDAAYEAAWETGVLHMERMQGIAFIADHFRMMSWTQTQETTINACFGERVISLATVPWDDPDLNKLLLLQHGFEASTPPPISCPELLCHIDLENNCQTRAMLDGIIEQYSKRCFYKT